MPKAYIDDGIGQMMIPNPFVDLLFLVAEVHYSAWRRDGGEATRNKSLGPGLCGCIDERELVQLSVGTDSTDDGVVSADEVGEVVDFQGVDVADDDFDATRREFFNILLLC